MFFDQYKLLQENPIKMTQPELGRKIAVEKYQP